MLINNKSLLTFARHYFTSDHRPPPVHSKLILPAKVTANINRFTAITAIIVSTVCLAVRAEIAGVRFCGWCLVDVGIAGVVVITYNNKIL